MNKPIVVNSYNGILLKKKKKKNEGLVCVTTWMKLKNTYAKPKNSAIKESILYDSICKHF